MQEQMQAKNFDAVERDARIDAHKARIDMKMREYRKICERYGVTETDFPDLGEEKRGDCLTEFRCMLPSGKYRDAMNRIVYLESLEFVHAHDRAIDCIAMYHDGTQRIRIPIDAFIELRGFVHMPDAASL